MLSFLHYNTELDFSDLDWDEMDTCFLHSMLHFTFAIKKGFHRNLDLIWFNKIFFVGNESFRLID